MVTYAMVRGPMAGSSFSHPSKQLMADEKQSSSMLEGRPGAAGSAISGGRSVVDAIPASYLTELFSSLSRQKIAVPSTDSVRKFANLLRGSEAS